jgi:hypothetical protein
MTETKFRQLLTELLYEASDEGADAGIHSLSSFEDHGLMTSNEGLVIRMQDGSEFQLTIVASR